MDKEKIESLYEQMKCNAEEMQAITIEINYHEYNLSLLRPKHNLLKQTNNAIKSIIDLEKEKNEV